MSVEQNEGTLRIAQWSEGFKRLYGKNDDKRAPEEFWNASMAHMSSIGEAIRRYDYISLLKSSAHAFCWMCCYINKCNNTSDRLFKINNSFSEIVGLKYPKICGHCRRNVCECKAASIDEMPDKSSRYEQLYNEWQSIKFNEYTLRSWLNMFGQIFNQNNHLLTLENIGFHLLEEAGEHALAIRQLVQLRGMTTEIIPDIDELLVKISNIDGLVEEYKKSTEDLKSKYDKDNANESWKSLKLDDEDPIVLKARIIKGKMDLIIEFGDTFSWFCAVLLKLEKIIEKEKLPEGIEEKFNIEKVLTERYSCIINENGSEQYAEGGLILKCYACESVECKCLFYPKLIDQCQ